MSDGNGGDTPRKEIYTYQAPWVVFSLAWSRKYVMNVEDDRIKHCIFLLLEQAFGAKIFNPCFHFN
jgi:hypothetical protein